MWSWRFLCWSKAVRATASTAVLVVDVDEAVQMQRVHGTRRQHRRNRRAQSWPSQASRAARLAAADDVLQNTGTVADLRQAVDRLHEHYLRLANSSCRTRDLT